jgi:hypothetical protein
MGLSQLFPLSRDHKDNLELLTITTMSNTNFSRCTTRSGGSMTTSNRLGARLQE